jgi:hypothetical protein
VGRRLRYRCLSDRCLSDRGLSQGGVNGSHGGPIERATVRLTTRLLFLPGDIVISVPLILDAVDEPDRIGDMRA